MNKQTRKALVGFFFALMFTYAGLNAYQTFTFPHSDPGWSARGLGAHARVKQVDPETVASVLQVGDEVLALNGQPLREIPQAAATQPLKQLIRLEPGTGYTISVNREGQTHLFALKTETLKTKHWLLMAALCLLLPASCLFVGLAVFLLKPNDKQALLLALMFGTFIPPTGAGWIDNLPTLFQALTICAGLCTVFVFSFLLHFFLIFPEPSPLLRRFPRLEWLLYLLALFFTLPLSIIAMLWETGSTLAPRFQLPSALFAGRGFLAILYPACAVLSLTLNYRQASEVAKRKMRVVVAGMLIGVLPAIVFFFLIVPSVDLGRISPTLSDWLPFVAALALPLMPFSFAYAIVRHQVIPVTLIIRRSVQYLFAKNALRLIVVLPVVHLAYLILSQRDRTIGQIVFGNTVSFYFVLIAAASASLVFRHHLRDWIDRKFFREAYDQEKILRELIDDVKKADSTSELARLISDKVESALHPQRIYLFYREEERRDLSLGYSSGGTHSELRIPEDFRLLRFLEDQGSAQDFPFPRKNSLPESEKDWLQRLGTNLIVPMNGTDGHLTGLLLLGRKKSEVPYTAGDRDLLETLADQIAIVYENVRLKSRIDLERKIKHEVLSRLEDRNINLLKECPSCGACYDSEAQQCAKDNSELTLSLPVERIIDDRYRLDQLIGKGGMGAVYQATDRRLNRKVAVKILTSSMFGNSQALRRFEREARASARLSHPNITTVHDYGLLSTEGAYLVMELLEGQTLGSLMRRRGLLPPGETAGLFDQVLEGLKAAHNAGIVHRDLKPENILIVKDEQGQSAVKILDFGLAKLAARDDSNSGELTAVTTPGTVMGTFGYMAPEQLTGSEVDERSDLFSVAVMVVEALTGRRPFAGKTHHEVLTNIVQKSFHLADQSPEARRLDNVLQRCLAKNPSERVPSAAGMQQDLIPAIRECPGLSLRGPAGSDADTVIWN